MNYYIPGMYSKWGNTEIQKLKVFLQWRTLSVFHPGNRVKGYLPIAQAKKGVLPCWVYHSEGQKLSHKASVQSLVLTAVSRLASLLKQDQILYLRLYPKCASCSSRPWQHIFIHSNRVRKRNDSPCGFIIVFILVQRILGMSYLLAIIFCRAGCSGSEL
jgi:hypothetical protein